MEFDTGSFLASLFVSGIGWVFFSYGRKMKKPPQIVTGLVLLVYPYFIGNIWIMLSIAAVILTGFWYAWKQQIFY